MSRKTAERNLSRKASQKSDKATQRWNRVEAETPFEDLQPSALSDEQRSLYGPRERARTKSPSKLVSVRGECKGCKRTEYATAKETRVVFLREMLQEACGDVGDPGEDHAFQSQDTGLSLLQKGK